MIRDCRFKDIEEYLKKDSQIGKDVLEALNKLAYATIIFSPIVLGPQLLAFLRLLDTKDRLGELGKTVIGFVASKRESDYVKRAEQIRTAYALICYTAYFDALPGVLSTDVREKLMKKCEKEEELIEGMLSCFDDSLTPSPDIHCNVYITDHVTSFLEIKESLTGVYERISQELVKIIDDSSIFNEENPKEKKQFDELRASLMALPNEAIVVYEAQYLKLATQFDDFAFFSQLNNFNSISSTVKKTR